MNTNNNWRPFVLATLAALSLQACDIQVNTAGTKVQAPQASLPEDAQLNAPAATAAVTPPPAAPEAPAVTPEPAPATETTAQVPTTAPAPEVTAQVPAQPDTGTLGAPAATPATTSATPAATPEAAVQVSTGAAAPTELGRFFEENAARAAGETKAGSTKPAKKS